MKNFLHQSYSSDVPTRTRIEELLVHFKGQLSISQILRKAIAELWVKEITKPDDR